jgi:hypothetical protein
VEKYHDLESNTYYDFIKGNYSYSIDGGVTFVVNTIASNFGNNNPENNAMYSSGPRSNLKIGFSFKDIIHNKYADATFTFEDINLNQLHFVLMNRGGGYILPDVPPNPSFCIPNDEIVTKQ